MKMLLMNLFVLIMSEIIAQYKMNRSAKKSNISFSARVYHIVKTKKILAKKEIKEAEKKNGRTWWTFKHPMFCPFHVLLKKIEDKKGF